MGAECRTWAASAGHGQRGQDMGGEGRKRRSQRVSDRPPARPPARPLARLPACSPDRPPACAPAHPPTHPYFQADALPYRRGSTC